MSTTTNVSWRNKKDLIILGMNKETDGNYVVIKCQLCEALELLTPVMSSVTARLNLVQKTSLNFWLLIMTSCRLLCVCRLLVFLKCL